jgi:predicted dehydrogenase
VRAGIIGAGHMGRYHVAAYSELYHVDLVGVCDIDPKKTELAAAPFELPTYTDYHDLFGKVDVVSIAVPTHLHYPIARDVLEHGIHVLLEKPITPTLDEARDLFRIAGERDLVLHVGHVERFNGAVQEMKKIVDRPYLVESRRIGPWTGRINDAGVVLDLLIHDLDIVLNLVGGEVVKLDVQGRKIRSDFEDLVTVQMEFESGTLATMLASRVSEEKIRTLTVHQPKAYVFLDYSSQEIHIHRQAGSSSALTSQHLSYRQESIVERLFVHKGNPLKFEIQHFIEHAMDKSKHKLNTEQELRSLGLALEILAHLRDRQ